MLFECGGNASDTTTATAKKYAYVSDRVDPECEVIEDWVAVHGHVRLVIQLDVIVAAIDPNTSDHEPTENKGPDDGFQ